MRTGMHGAAARTEINDDRKTERLLIEANGAGDIAHV